MLAKVRLMILLTLSLPQLAQALIVSGGLGMGTTQMSNETTESEGPFTQAFTVERLFHSRLALGVEHLRSLTAQLNTSAAFTGLVARYYINSAPVKVYAAEELSYEEAFNHDYAIFVGGSGGYAQSSRLPNDVGLSSNAAGFYLSMRGGLDYQMTKHIGVRGEFIYATTLIAKGGVAQMSLGGALYWMF